MIRFIFLKNRSLWAAICLFLSIPPMALGINEPPLLAKISFAFLMIVSTNFRKQSKRIFAIVMSILYIYYAYCITDTLVAFVLTVLYISIFTSDCDFIRDVFKCFTYIYTAAMTLSLFVYFGVLLGLNLPSSIIDLDFSSDGIPLTKYPFLTVRLLRFCGMFDEPGVVGTTSAVILLTNQFKLNKILLIPLLLSGLVSFSLFFYLSLFFYAILLSRSYKGYLYTGCLFAILYYYFYDYLDDLILNRLKIEDGVWVGNNRDHFDKQWWDNFVHSSRLLVGYQTNISSQINEGGASYKDIIMNAGLLFFISFLGELFFYSKKVIYHKKQWILCIFIIGSVLFQRPFLGNPFYLFLIVAPIFNITHKKTIK